MQLNTDLVTLLILYVRDQEELYVDYHDGFIRLAQFLYFEELVSDANIYEFPSDAAPDICSECLAIDTTMTRGGRVRDGCPECKGLLPYKDKTLHIIWKQRFCEILKMNEAYFDYHLAHALEYIRSSKQRDKEQPSKESV